MKLDDVYTITLTTTSTITEIEIQDVNACQYKLQVSSASTIIGVIADRGDVVQSLTSTLRMKDDNGT